MLSLVILLSLAFAIGRGISALGTGRFLASLVEGRVSGAFGPAIIFILGAVVSFCTGTSWGTFSIMMPIAIPMAVSMDSNILLAIGAVISGGIFGDHCSPLSDTTILSSMSAGTDLYSHVRTQLPYALVCAAGAAVLFVIFGFVL
jgi:Na+/H+ antiporter NhaC